MSIQIIFLAHQNKRVKKPSKYKENVYLFSLIILEFSLSFSRSLSPFLYYDNIMARQSLLIPYNKTFFLLAKCVCVCCCIFAWFFYYLLCWGVCAPKHNKMWIPNEGKSKEDEEESKKRTKEKKTRTCEGFCFPFPFQKLTQTHIRTHVSENMPHHIFLSFLL